MAGDRGDRPLFGNFNDCASEAPEAAIPGRTPGGFAAEFCMRSSMIAETHYSSATSMIAHWKHRNRPPLAALLAAPPPLRWKSRSGCAAVLGACLRATGDASCLIRAGRARSFLRGGALAMESRKRNPHAFKHLWIVAQNRLEKWSHSRLCP